jgi:hypothetical protein
MAKPLNRYEHHRQTASDAEKSIMAMWDNGHGSKVICKHLGLTENYVMNIISLMASNRHDSWQKPAVLATAQLASRIREVHPNRIGSI